MAKQQIIYSLLDYGKEYKVTKPKKNKINMWNYQWYVSSKLRSNIEEIIIENSLLDSAKKIVDFGCGDCPYEYIFERNGVDYIRCDLTGNNKADILVEPNKPLPIEDKVADGIVSFQVLEHVWDIDWYLNNSHRILKENGWLLLSAPGNWPYHPHPTDYRRWTKEGLEKELESHNFKVQKIIPIIGPLAWMTQYCLLVIYKLLKKIPLLGKILLMPISLMINLLIIIEDKITPISITNNNACTYVTLSRKI